MELIHVGGAHRRNHHPRDSRYRGLSRAFLIHAGRERFRNESEREIDIFRDFDRKRRERIFAEVLRSARLRRGFEFGNRRH